MIVLSDSTQAICNQIRCLSVSRWEFCQEYQVPNDQIAALVGTVVRWLVKFPDQEQVKLSVEGMEILIGRVKGTGD